MCDEPKLSWMGVNLFFSNYDLQMPCRDNTYVYLGKVEEKGRNERKCWHWLLLNSLLLSSNITKGGGGGGLVTKSCLTLVTPWTVACHFHLQGIFLTQELNTDHLQCRQILYRLSYK